VGLLGASTPIPEAQLISGFGCQQRLWALQLADAYLSKYGDDWVFTVSDAAFDHHGSKAFVYQVRHSKAFGFGRGEFSQTRWRF